MADFPRNLWFCALAIAGHTALAAQGGEEQKDLLLDSASLTLDRKTNLIQLTKPRIAQGNLVIDDTDSCVFSHGDDCTMNTLPNSYGSYL